MKKTVGLVLLFFAATFLCACGNKNTIKSPVLGTWFFNIYDGGNGGAYLTFWDDGTCEGPIVTSIKIDEHGHELTLYDDALRWSYSNANRVLTVYVDGGSKYTNKAFMFNVITQDDTLRLECLTDPRTKSVIYTKSEPIANPADIPETPFSYFRF